MCVLAGLDLNLAMPSRTATVVFAAELLDASRPVRLFTVNAPSSTQRLSPYEVLPEERAAFCDFALQYPKMGYRKVTWLMNNAEVARVGESTVYRNLRAADLHLRWKRSVASNSEYSFRPTAPNQQWHTDVMYAWVAARFYFLVSFVDAYSRYIVHHKLLMSLDGKSGRDPTLHEAGDLASWTTGSSSRRACAANSCFPYAS